MSCECHRSLLTVPFSFHWTGSGDVQMMIRAADGRVVRNERAQSNDRMVLDVSDLTDGIYVCSVANDRTRLVGRLVVQH